MSDQAAQASSAHSISSASSRLPGGRIDGQGLRLIRAVLAAAATLVLLRLRVPDAFLYPQFWSEDGGVFFQQGYIDGPSAFLSPYAGYLHLAPRLVAWLASPFGAVPAPALYFAASVALAMWAAFTAATANIRHAWALGATMLLVPHTGEVFATITGIQWLLAPVMALALATPMPEAKWARINQLVFVAVAAFTGPFSVFAAPLALWRLWRDRTHFAVALATIVLVAALVQAAVAYFSLGLVKGAEPEPFALALALADRWFGELAHGSPQTQSLWQALATAVIVAAAVSSLFIKERRETFALLFCFVLIGLAATEVRFMGHRLWRHFLDAGGYDRYFYIPRLVAIWSIALLILDFRLRSLLGVIAAVLIVVNCAFWTKRPMAKLLWKGPAALIDRGEAARIAINPLTKDGPVWFVDVPTRAR